MAKSSVSQSVKILRNRNRSATETVVRVLLNGIVIIVSLIGSGENFGETPPPSVVKPL